MLGSAMHPLRSGPKSMESHFWSQKCFVHHVFPPLVNGVGGCANHIKLTTGFDFTKPEVRDQVAQELRDNPPDLLVLCPPCMDEGGWFHVSSCTMGPKELASRIHRSRLFIRFCRRLFDQQVQAGGRALLEHPKGSKLWTYPEIRALLETHELLTCHMCRYGHVWT